MSQIYKISLKEELNECLDEISGVLSRAFYNDPYYIHIMPDNKKRISQIQWWMKILLRYSYKNGNVIISSDHKGAAILLGPKKPTINNIRLAISGLILYPFKVGIRNFINMLTISSEWEKEHSKQNKDHYYLMIIGVDPKFQRIGTGDHLIKDMLVRADNQKLDCYLETVTNGNVLFYKKYGFEIISNKKFGNDYQYWIMKRLPK